VPPKSDKPAIQELLGDESARGMELVLTPVVFGGFGWILDGWLGSGPWLAVAFVAFALVGTVAKIWYGYDAEMRELESSGRWARRDNPEPSAPVQERDLWADRKAQA